MTIRRWAQTASTVVVEVAALGPVSFEAVRGHIDARMARRSRV